MHLLENLYGRKVNLTALYRQKVVLHYWAALTPPPFLATFGTQKRHYDPQLTTTSTTTSRTPFSEVRTLTSHRRTTFKGGRWLWLSVLCQNLSVSHSHVSLSLSLTFYLFVSMSLSLSLTLFLFVSMSPSLYLKHSICLFSLHFHLFNTAW